MSDRTPPPHVPGGGVIINGPGPADWIETYQTLALVALAALPVAALLTWWLARRRCGAGSTSASAWRRSLAEVGIVYGTLPWLWLTLLPASTSRVGHGTVSLVPLKDLATMPTYQILGNLLVFAAFGFLAPLRFPALASILRVLAVAAVGSIGIETAQYVAQLGRVSSLDDVLLNTLGAGLAALTSLPWWHHQAAAPAPDWEELAPEAV